MSDISLKVRFDGGEGISFVQGEDRQIELSFVDLNKALPVSLMGAQIALHMPRQGDGGGTIKRRLAPATVAYLGAAAQGTTLTLFALRSHGFVSGETVQVQAMGAAGLPAPLLADTNYLISAPDSDQFGLTTMQGVPVIITEPLPMAFYVEQTNVVTVANALLGLATVSMPAVVTAAVAPGIGSPLQVVYKDATGLTRVYLQNYGLDVAEQVLA